MNTNIVALVIAIVLCGLNWMLVKTYKRINNLKKDLNNINDDIAYREKKIDDRIYRIHNRIAAIEGGEHWLVVRHVKDEFDEELSYVTHYLIEFRNLKPIFGSVGKKFFDKEDAEKALRILKDCVAINQFTGEEIEGSEYVFKTNK